MSSYPPPPPGYGAPPPPPPPSSQPQPYGPAGVPLYRPTDNGAVASLVVGAVSIVLVCACQPLALVGGVVAFILGLSARRRITASAGGLGGDGMALAGVITGAIGAGLGAITSVILVVYIILVANGIASGTIPLTTPTP